MTIKEVSEQTGLSQDTLRYYERVGMIPEVTRTAGGTRDYQEEDMNWVQLVKCMRSAGLPIEVIHDYDNRHTIYTYGKVTVKKGCPR